MAMAAVRLAARRLTGQLPQAILRAGVRNEHGLLNRGAYARRFASSEASAANGPKISTEHPSLSRDSRLMAADRKKEELVDLLHEIQMNKDIPRARRMKDRWLLHRLTEHVDTRPNIPKWRWYLREQKVGNCLRATAIVLAFLYMVKQWSALGRYIFEGADSDSKTNASCAE